MGGYFFSFKVEQTLYRNITNPKVNFPKQQGNKYTLIEGKFQCFRKH